MPPDAPGEAANAENTGREDSPLHPVSLETANLFLQNNEQNAVFIAIGVMLCIISSVVLILTESLAGIIFLLLCIGIFLCREDWNPKNLNFWKRNRWIQRTVLRAWFGNVRKTIPERISGK